MSGSEEYPLEYLIDRFYDAINKSVKSSDNKRLVIDPPVVSTANRKSHFQNFETICNTLNRDKLDVQKFFEVELSTTTSIDSKGMLLINGTFRSNNIRRVLMNYLTYYVICKECGSNKTKIVKENRIQYLDCSNCLSKKAI